VTCSFSLTLSLGTYVNGLVPFTIGLEAVFAYLVDLFKRGLFQPNLITQRLVEFHRFAKTWLIRDKLPYPALPLQLLLSLRTSTTTQTQMGFLKTLKKKNLGIKFKHREQTTRRWIRCLTYCQDALEHVFLRHTQLSSKPELKQLGVTWKLTIIRQHASFLQGVSLKRLLCLLEQE